MKNTREAKPRADKSLARHDTLKALETQNKVSDTLTYNLSAIPGIYCILRYRKS